MGGAAAKDDWPESTDVTGGGVYGGGSEGSGGGACPATATGGFSFALSNYMRKSE